MLYDLLNENDKEKISNYIDTYSGDHRHSNEDRAPLSYLLRYWNSNKEDLYNLFGKEFIIEKEITIHKSIEEIENNISDCLDDYDHPIGRFYNNFRSFLRDKFGALNNNGYWENFAVLDTKNYWDIMELLRADSLAKNKYSGRNFKIEINGKVVSIQNGCKPVKMIGKIVKLLNYNEEEYESFRLAQSLETNQRTLKGTLCLSIHPLDYMTMSDNDSGWESCMNWMNLGCYCRGTVEMMNSPYVIVAYLKADKDMTFDGCRGPIEWNNKKWRQLFICDKKFMTSIKAYPYRSDELSFEVLNWLNELATVNWGIDYNNPTIYDYEYGYNEFLNKQAKFKFETNTMYNDFGTVQHHIIVANEYLNSNDKLEFILNYSGEEICMFCGDGYDFDGEGCLLCSDCDDYITCDECGDRINYNDMYEVDGAHLCEYCYENCTFEDPITNEVHLSNNAIPVRFISDEEAEDLENIDLSWHPSIEIYEDYDINDLKYYFNIDELPSFRRTKWGSIYYYVTVSMLKDSAYELFNGDYSSNEDLIQDIIEK